MRVHVVDTCVRVSSHSQIQLIKMREKLFLWRCSWESPRRWGWAQVADGRCSQAEEQTHPHAWNSPSTVKRRGVLRQSLTAKTPELLLMFGVIKSGPVRLELSCGLVREGCHLLVDWWYYNPGGKGEERWKKKRKRGVERSCIHLIVLLSA